jgi:hypothetical protein
MCSLVSLAWRFSSLAPEQAHRFAEVPRLGSLARDDNKKDERRGAGWRDGRSFLFATGVPAMRGVLGGAALRNPRCATAIGGRAYRIKASSNINQSYA